VAYEWDPRKARENLSKHGVRFSDGTAALEDPFAVTVEDVASNTEQRFITIGADDQGRIVVVA